MAEQLPEYKATATLEPANIPDFGSAYRQFAATQTTFSEIGSRITQAASTQQAINRGYEEGLNPHGDLLPPISQFDKTFVDSYNQQAHSVLSIQAQKLMNDADLEMSKAPRITPELISRTNNQLSQGLEQILKQAPVQVKSQLQATFASSLLQQNHQYGTKMISQQRKDQTDNIRAGFQVNYKNAYEFAANGDFEGAEKVVAQTKQAGASGVGGNLIDKSEANIAYDTARQAYLNGKNVYEAGKAKKEGKYEEYLKKYADADPKSMGMTIAEKDTAGQAVMNHFAVLDNLSRQDQQLSLARFNVAVAKDPIGSGALLETLRNQVSPIQFEQAQLTYINAVKSFNKSQGDVAQMSAMWGSPEAHARAGTPAVNKTFDSLVERHQKQMEAAGIPTKLEDSQIQVAASAGGKVPVFVNGLENQINSANPNEMESAAYKMHELIEMGAGRAYIGQGGVSEKSQIAADKYMALRSIMPPEEAARQVSDTVLNQTPEMLNMAKEKFANQMTAVAKNIPPTDYALQKIGGFKPSQFVNVGTANTYGAMILDMYSTAFQNSGGDATLAANYTKKMVQENFGETGVNGIPKTTLHPIEKVLGFEGNSDIVPYIQRDIAAHLEKHFGDYKAQFNERKDYVEKNPPFKTNDYWEVVPSEYKNKARVYGNEYDPIKVKHYARDARGKVTENTYDVVITGNSFNWDIGVLTESGLRPMFQMAPYLGVMTYSPSPEIKSQYMKDHKIGE